MLGGDYLGRAELPRPMAEGVCVCDRQGCAGGAGAALTLPAGPGQPLAVPAQGRAAPRPAGVRRGVPGS